VFLVGFDALPSSIIGVAFVVGGKVLDTGSTGNVMAAPEAAAGAEVEEANGDEGTGDMSDAGGMNDIDDANDGEAGAWSI
jgi:hypothetical protein